MDYEGAVAQYLTVDRNFSIRPQFEINLPNWTAYPDFLACSSKEAFLVEVTTNANATHLAKKIGSSLVPNLKEIERILRSEEIIGQSSSLRIWAFVRADQFKRFSQEIAKFGPHVEQLVKRTPLELTAFSWFYWSARANGNEPSFDDLLAAMTRWASDMR